MDKCRNTQQVGLENLGPTTQDEVVSQTTKQESGLLIQESFHTSAYFFDPNYVCQKVLEFLKECYGLDRVGFDSVVLYGEGRTAIRITDRFNAYDLPHIKTPKCGYDWATGVGWGDPVCMLGNLVLRGDVDKYQSSNFKHYIGKPNSIEHVLSIASLENLTMASHGLRDGNFFLPEGVSIRLNTVPNNRIGGEFESSTFQMIRDTHWGCGTPGIRFQL